MAKIIYITFSFTFLWAIVAGQPSDVLTNDRFSCSKETESTYKCECSDLYYGVPNCDKEKLYGEYEECNCQHYSSTQRECQGEEEGTRFTEVTGEVNDCDPHHEIYCCRPPPQKYFWYNMKNQQDTVFFKNP